MISCNSSKKEENNCTYNNINNCQDFISKIIYDKGSVMPPDGIVPLEDWTYFLAYFDSNTNQITEVIPFLATIAAAPSSPVTLICPSNNS